MKSPHISQEKRATIGTVRKPLIRLSLRMFSTGVVRGAIPHGTISSPISENSVSFQICMALTFF